jgi:hypothetical protein
MNTTDWLIIATAAGPIVATLVAPGLISAVLKLAKARAQRITHVPASGADLYAYGVLLTEAQFREAFGAMQAELEELPQQADRNEWELKRGFAAINRLSVLAGTYPQAFPIRGDGDSAWAWYAANNPYAARDLPHIHGMPVSPDWLADPARLLARPGAR